MPTVTKNEISRVLTYEKLTSGKWANTYTTIDFTINDTTKPLTLKRARPKSYWEGITARTVSISRRVAGRNSTIAPDLRTHQYFHVDPGSYANYVIRPKGLNTKLALRIKDQVSNLNVTIPELGKTTDMFVKTSNDIQNYFHRLRHGRLLSEFIRDMKNPRDPRTRQLSRHWLELQMGWIPTLMDIHGLSTALYRKAREGWIFAKVSQTENRVVETRNINYKTLLIRATVEERLTARYRVATSGLKALSEVGLTNPALAAWELVPYSFVFDYMIGIGDWLSAFDALTGVESFSFYRGSKTMIEVNAMGPSSFSEHTYAISKLTELTRGNLEVNLPIELPRVDVSDNLKKIAHSVALLRNLR